MNEATTKEEARLRAAAQRLAVMLHRQRRDLGLRTPGFWLHAGTLTVLAARGQVDGLLAACERTPGMLGTPGDFERWPLVQAALVQFYEAYKAAARHRTAAPEPRGLLQPDAEG